MSISFKNYLRCHRKLCLCECVCVCVCCRLRCIKIKCHAHCVLHQTIRSLHSMCHSNSYRWIAFYRHWKHPHKNCRPSLIHKSRQPQSPEHQKQSPTFGNFAFFILFLFSVIYSFSYLFVVIGTVHVPCTVCRLWWWWCCCYYYYYY